MDITVHIVMAPEEEWVCVPQGDTKITLNRANIHQLTSAQELMECILRQSEASLHARGLRDSDSLSSSGLEENV